MDAALPFAQRMLREEGAFLPYGAVLGSDGEIRDVSGYDGRECPPAPEIISLLKRAFVDGADSGDYRATALVYDVRVVLPTSGEKSDAIAVALDHRDHYSVVVLFPYQLVDGELALGDVFAQKGSADIFPS